MYKFELSSKEKINKFNDESDKGHIFQTSYWCDFKSEWNQHYIKGVDDKKKVVLTCSLLTRKVPYLNKFIGYVPRGFVCDYSNKGLIKSFANFLKKFAKENKISFITVDADIHFKENENVTEVGQNTKSILREAGFVFADAGNKNFEAIQPNFVFRLDIENKDNLSIEEHKKRVHNNFEKKWIYNIKVANQRCLEVEWYDKTNVPDELITEFHNIMVETGKRDNFLVRNRMYFDNLIKKVGPYSRLYMVKYNLKQDKENSLQKIEKITKEIDDLEVKIAAYIKGLEEGSEDCVGAKKMQSHIKDTKKVEILTAQLNKLKERVDRINETGKDFMYLSGAIYLYYGNKAWYLYGASRDVFRDTMTNYGMQWAMISDSIDLGLDVYDFRGVSGDVSEDNPLYGLYKFKKGFSGDFVEFIGECDLVLDKLIYKAFKEMFPKYKKVRANLRKKRSGE